MSAAGDVEERLVQAGLSVAQATAKASLFGQACRALEQLAGNAAADSVRYFVPGRIEVLGKHTDYAGGRSLLCAAEKGVCLVASRRCDNRLRIVDAVDGARVDLFLSPDMSSDAVGWAVYPAAVARRVTRNFPNAAGGADLAFASDLPRAAGLSSSSALVVAVFVALADARGLFSRPEFASVIGGREELAEYLGCVENGLPFGPLGGERGAGAFTGSEDQTAILCSRRGELSQYAFRPVRHERSVSLPDEWTFVVASSGVASDKTGRARDRYNSLSLAARVVEDCWRSAVGGDGGTLLDAAASSSDAPRRMHEILSRSSHPEFPPRILRGRFDQFFEECIEIIPAAADALAGRDERAFGSLVDRSQSLAERLLGNQIPETIALTRAARARGAIAASAFGGGFGGSVWALVPARESFDFRSRWARDYADAFPGRAGAAEFFETRPGPAALRLDPQPRLISDLI